MTRGTLGVSSTLTARPTDKLGRVAQTCPQSPRSKADAPVVDRDSGADPKGPDLIFGSRKTSPSIAPVVQESILPALHSHMPGQARHNVVRREDQPSHPRPIQRRQGLRVLAPTLCLAHADAVRTSSSGQSRSSHSADARRRPHLSTRRSRRESPIGRRLTDYFNGSTEPALGTHHVSRPPRPAIRPRSVAGWHSCP